MSRLLLRLAGWVGYAVLLVGGFLIAAYLSFSSFVRSGVTAVPELEGLPRERATALLRDHGLEMEVRPEARYDDLVPAGHVVLQEPGGGSLVKRGAEVEIVISLGQERIEVPLLEGRALQAAQVTLNDTGLSLGRTLSVYSDRARPGTVAAQNPPAGSRVGRGTSVEVFLSLEGREETFLMPDLVYRRLLEVERYFGKRGFRLGSVKFEVYEGIAPGIVLRQHPLPGHPLTRYDVVSLVVTARAEEA